MTIRILAAGLAALLPMLAAAEAGAQTGGQPTADEGRLDPTPCTIHVERVRVEPEELRFKPHPLFEVDLSTNLSLSGKGVYYLEDACAYAQAALVEYARNELLPESRKLLEEMLVERGFNQKLKQSISDRLRERLLDRFAEGVAPPPPPPPSLLPPLPLPPPPLTFPPPDARWIATGTLLFAGGGVLSASDNDWPIDEGYIGVGIAVVGLGLVFKQLVPEWRGARIQSSGPNLSIAW